MIAPYPGLNRVADIRRMVDDLAQRFSERPDVVTSAARITATMDSFATGARATPWREPTLFVYSTDPVGAFGTGTYLDDLARGMGATNAIADDGWVKLSLEDVTRLDPAAIVLVQTQADDGTAAQRLAVLPIAAARNDRINVLVHPDALMPSTAVVDVAGQLHAALEAFVEPAS